MKFLKNRWVQILGAGLLPLLPFLYWNGWFSLGTDAPLTVWRFERGSQSVLLVGEVHGQPVSSEQRRSALRRWLSGSEAYGVELDAKEWGKQKRHDAQGRKISGRLGAYGIQKLNDRMAGLALPTLSASDWRELDPLHPLLAADLLQKAVALKKGFVSDPRFLPSAVDDIPLSVWFERLAVGKPMLSLETGDIRQATWDSTCGGNDDVTNVLVEAVDAAKDAKARQFFQKDLGDALEAGNVAVWDRFLSDKSDSRFMAHLYRCSVAPRNQVWVASIEDQLMRHKSIAYLVGVAHLAGEQSLQALLKDKGFVGVRLK